MADKVTYYAVVNDLSSREDLQACSGAPTSRPVVERDEAFTQDLVWEYSTAMLVSAERGDLDNEFIEITEDEANQIVERIRAKVTGASST